MTLAAKKSFNHLLQICFTILKLQLTISASTDVSGIPCYLKQ